MDEIYKEKVIQAYKKQKEEGTLSINLINPSPRKLRDECLIVYNERYNPKDDDILRLFFSSKNKNGDYSQSIINFRIDELRPLVNILNGRIKRPNDKNINLLSWLIDFEPRPYRFGQTYNEPEKAGKAIENQTPSEESIIDNGETVTTDTAEPTIVNTKTPWKKIGIAALFAILLGAVSIFIYSKSTTRDNNKVIGDNQNNTTNKKTLINNPEQVHQAKPIVTNNKQCMYWDNDHYEAINCNEKIEGKSIIALETQILTKLKRITRPDTLSKKHLGKIWYVKVITDSVEFYTDSGYYPLDEKKRLRPLTQYILNKYPNGYSIYKK